MIFLNNKDYLFNSNEKLTFIFNKNGIIPLYNKEKNRKHLYNINNYKTSKGHLFCGIGKPYFISEG